MPINKTASKTIPILLQTVDLTLYPEGGVLVAGLPARVYLEARTPAKKPADLEGVIVDDRGKQVATFATEHEGRGRFGFTPEKGRRYTLKIEKPSGIKTTYPLPAVKGDGAVISYVADVVASGGNIKLKIGKTSPGKVAFTICSQPPK